MRGFGAQIGVSNSSVTGAEIEEGLRSKLNLHGGFVYSCKVYSSFISIQSGLFISRKGYIKDDRYQPTLTWDMDYLEVPVLTQFQAKSLFFEVGPQFSYLLDSRGKLKGTDNKASLKEMNTKYTLGYAAGIGAFLLKSFNAGIRYTGTVTSPLTKIASVPPRVQHSVFQFYVSYPLNLK